MTAAVQRISEDNLHERLAVAGLRGELKVLMLTAAGVPGDRVTGLSLGTDDYLGEPFHFPRAGAAGLGAGPQAADSAGTYLAGARDRA